MRSERKNILLFSDNLRLKISFFGSMILKDGEEYVNVDKCKVDVKIVELKMNFEQLFKNDKVLSDLGNSLVNQNVDLFIKDVEPSLETSLCKQSTFVCASDSIEHFLFFSENILEVCKRNPGKSSVQCLFALKIPKASNVKQILFRPNISGMSSKECNETKIFYRCFFIYLRQKMKQNQFH